MANTADLNAKIDAINNFISVERQQYLDAIAAKDQTISDLQGQLSNAITSADADAIGSRLDQVATDVQTIVP